MLILDTDVLSIIQRGESDIRYERLAALLDEVGDSVSVTAVTLGEQMRGALAEINHVDAAIRIRGYRRLTQLTEDYAHQTILPYDSAAEAIVQKLRAMKVRVPTMDLRIAAIALAHAATLVTANVKDFAEIPELNLLPLQDSHGSR